jgi:hypothetical protein
MLEQIRLAEAYVRYDNVSFSTGSFTNRVQAKTAAGSMWLTVPLKRSSISAINETEIDNTRNWRRAHTESLRHAYSRAPFRDEMLDLVNRVFDIPARTIGDLSFASMWALADYFGVSDGVMHFDAAEMEVAGASSERLLGVVQAVGCTTYVTGHGAMDYLDHGMFERAGIRVEYMDYQRLPYPQLHGKFNPHVSSLDLVANMGRAGAAVIASTTIDWKNIIK